MKADKQGKRHIIKWTLLMMSLALVLFILIMNVPVFYETIGYRFDSYIQGVSGNGEQGRSAAIRDTIRSLAFSEWGTSPIFGHGFDSFKYLSIWFTGYFFYSHCNYAELLYDGGLLLTVAYYSVFAIILKQTLVDKRGALPFRAFAVSTIFTFLIYDYIAITYSAAICQLLIMLSLKGLTFNDDRIKKLCQN